MAEQESIRLKEIDEIKNRLYTNITHEFRTPLTVIQGMAQLVTGKYPKEMSLSRSQLYRKTKALTGQSASSYLRAFRLHHGRQLLQKTDLSVAEVAYRVGFNDPSYFSKSYAEQFGYPPRTGTDLIFGLVWEIGVPSGRKPSFFGFLGVA